MTEFRGGPLDGETHDIGTHWDPCLPHVEYRSNNGDRHWYVRVIDDVPGRGAVERCIYVGPLMADEGNTDYETHSNPR